MKIRELWGEGLCCIEICWRLKVVLLKMNIYLCA